MFGPIGGFVPGVVPVGAGQVLLADRTARLSWRQWWHLRHVGVIVSASETLPPGTVRHLESGRYYPPENVWRDVPNGEYDTYETGVITAPRLVQAMPSGAEEIDMRQQKHWTSDHIYVRPAYVWPGEPNESVNGEVVALAARMYVGRPYSFLDYAAILGVHLGIRNGPLRSYVRTTGHMICSQLADQALADAGFHVFDDGRLPQDVVPAELFRALMRMPGTLHIHPGQPAWVPVTESCSHS
jgi:hypothetical protein